MKLRRATNRLYRAWLWLRDRQNRLWVTPGLTGLGAVALAFAANAIGVHIADKVPRISVETIDDLLSVIASSMLAIAIFCLATLVSALSTSSMTATPRATALVMGDASARTSIGSFVAAFIFAVVARTALGVGYYDDGGRFVLFVSTMIVVTVVVFRLLLWIRAGARLGRLGDTIERICDVTQRALAVQACRPWMGACPPRETAQGAFLLMAQDCGYLTAINISGLQQLAEEGDLQIHVKVRPGAFIDPGLALATVEGRIADECLPELRECFVLSTARTFDQDAKYGMIVLAEVAMRALSPAVNDPGTAIEVMGLMTRVLVDYAAETRDPAVREEPRFGRITAPACDDAELVRDGFLPIARDGASMVEVGIRLQKMLAAIAGNAPGPLADEARRQAAHALRRARAALQDDEDRLRLERHHRELFPQPV